MNDFDDPAPYVQTEREGQYAYEMMDKLLDLEKGDQKSALKKGVVLTAMREAKCWEGLGFDTEVAMLSGHNLDVRTHQRIRRATVFYLEYGMDPTEWGRWGYSKLAYLAGHCTRENWKEVLDSVEGQSMKDLGETFGPQRDKPEEGFRRVECPRCGYHFEYRVPLHKQPTEARINTREIVSKVKPPKKKLDRNPNVD